MAVASMVSADTLSERAAALVEADILSGALAPGAKLGIAERAAHYDIGATPLREGLSRLVSRGLVDAIGQRGFRVKEISREDLSDIVCICTVIECEALRLSMAAGRGEWEGDIVAALHRLKRYVRDAGRDFGEGRPEFDVLHKAFHTSIIAACGSPRMLAAHSDLYDQAYRYRRLMMAKFVDPEEFLREHQTIADLAIARAGDKACANLAAHISSTLTHVYGGASGGSL
jgi:GntR family carbon starvation induced transcriptional regulator